MLILYICTKLLQILCIKHLTKLIVTFCIELEKLLKCMGIDKKLSGTFKMGMTIK